METNYSSLVAAISNPSNKIGWLIHNELSKKPLDIINFTEELYEAFANIHVIDFIVFYGSMHHQSLFSSKAKDVSETIHEIITPGPPKDVTRKLINLTTIIAKSICQMVKENPGVIEVKNANRASCFTSVDGKTIFIDYSNGDIRTWIGEETLINSIQKASPDLRMTPELMECVEKNSELTPVVFSNGEADTESLKTLSLQMGGGTKFRPTTPAIEEVDEKSYAGVVSKVAPAEPEPAEPEPAEPKESEPVLDSYWTGKLDLQCRKGSGFIRFEEKDGMREIFIPYFDGYPEDFNGKKVRISDEFVFKNNKSNYSHQLLPGRGFRENLEIYLDDWVKIID